MNKWTVGRMDRSLRESGLYGVETSLGTTHPLIIGENGKKFYFVFFFFFVEFGGSLINDKIGI